MADLKKQILQADHEHKLKFMKAPDLFEPDELIQVFSARTGKYLGTLKEGEEVSFNDQGEAVLIPEEEKDKSQLSLF